MLIQNEREEKWLQEKDAIHAGDMFGAWLLTIHHGGGAHRFGVIAVTAYLREERTTRCGIIADGITGVVAIRADSWARELKLSTSPEPQ